MTRPARPGSSRRCRASRRCGRARARPAADRGRRRRARRASRDRRSPRRRGRRARGRSNTNRRRRSSPIGSAERRPVERRGDTRPASRRRPGRRGRPRRGGARRTSGRPGPRRCGRTRGPPGSPRGTPGAARAPGGAGRCRRSAPPGPGGPRSRRCRGTGAHGLQAGLRVVEIGLFGRDFRVRLGHGQRASPRAARGPGGCGCILARSQAAHRRFTPRSQTGGAPCRPRRRGSRSPAADPIPPRARVRPGHERDDA